MAGALDLPLGVIYILMFIWAVGNVQTITGVTQGEQIIILIIAGYAALYGARLAGNVLIDMLVYAAKWAVQTNIGKAIAAKIT